MIRCTKTLTQGVITICCAMLFSGCATTGSRCGSQGCRRYDMAVVALPNSNDDSVVLKLDTLTGEIQEVELSGSHAQGSWRTIKEPDIR